MPDTAQSAAPLDQDGVLNFPLKRQLQWLFLLRVGVLSLLLGISLLLQSRNSLLPLPPIEYSASFIVGVYLFTIASSLLLNRISASNHFAYLQLITDVLLVTLLVIATGSGPSVFLVLYYFPIIAGGFMLYRRGGLFIAAVSTIAYGLALSIDFTELRPFFMLKTLHRESSDPLVAMHYFSIPSLTFFLVAILSSILSERLRVIEAALSRTTLDYDRLSLLYKQIFDDITSGIVTVDTSGRITSFNRASEEITGYQAKEVLGREIQHQFPHLRPESGEYFRPVVDLTRKDGLTIPVGYSWAKLNMPDKCEDCRIYTFQDLSLIKKMEDKVKQAEKMAAIGGMAAGIAHEFRNPLAAISGAAQVLTQEPEHDPMRLGLAKIIVRECDRLEETIREFLLFSKPAKPEKEWFSLRGLVENTRELLEQGRNWPPGCRLQIDIPANTDCWADPRQIKQVLFNLLNNSCNAMGESGGEIRIAAQEENRQGREWLTLTVADAGPGIGPELREKIFEPFFTTRENGTGLGLAIVRQIIESHGGEILVAGGPPGAEMIISLPIP